MKIELNTNRLNYYEFMANIAKINETKKLAKYSFDKKFLNKKTK